MEEITLKNDKQPLIAYFSMEYAVDDSLPIFAGGLGVLAGDTLHEASDQNRNFIGVGLFFHRAYLEQHISKIGEQIDGDRYIDPKKLQLELVLDKEQKPLIIEVPICDRQVKVKAWKKMVGKTTLILLDTHVEGGNMEDHEICNQLYAGDKTHRIHQELILGVGGVRMLREMGIRPDYYHLNEGHCAFLILEAIRQYRKSKKGRHKNFVEAQEYIKNKIIFTNHTIVAAGNDVFSNDLVSICLQGYAKELKVPFYELLQLGNVQDTAMFSMPLLALKHAKRTIAVSKMHAEIVNATWGGFNFIPITNGIYVPRWIDDDVLKVWSKSLKKSQAKTRFWKAHMKAKKRMLEEVEKRTGVKFEEEVLTITWARRIAEYKRPRAVLHDFERLKKILNNTDKPVQILIAGKTHRRNDIGKAFIKEIFELCKQEVRLAFVPNYDLTLAKYLVTGSDIWLNTPRKGYEACGTSGMKACLNGVLQMTIKDGWADEVDWDGIGWTLYNERPWKDIYDLLEGEVTDMYYTRDEEGIPSEWVDRMINSSNLIWNYFNTGRMLDEYYSKLYI